MSNGLTDLRTGLSDGTIAREAFYLTWMTMIIGLSTLAVIAAIVRPDGPEYTPISESSSSSVAGLRHGIVSSVADVRSWESQGYRCIPTSGSGTRADNPLTYTCQEPTVEQPPAQGTTTTLSLIRVQPKEDGKSLRAPRFTS